MNWITYFFHAKCLEEQELGRHQNVKLQDMWSKAQNECEKYKAQLPSLLSQITEQKGILDYTLFEKEKEIAELKGKITTYEDQIASLTKRNKELEEWGKRLSIESTQELTGNSPFKSFLRNPPSKSEEAADPDHCFVTRKLKKTDKRLTAAWEKGDLKRLKVTNVIPKD